MRQQALQLRYSGWGGRRDGAGRKPGPDPRIPHLRRESFPRRVPCHVTLKVREDVPTLRSRALVREMERSLSESSERGDFRVIHYSLQRDHVHMIVEATGRDALGRGMKSIAARLARAVNRVFSRRGPVLADRYHSRPLRTPREVRAALRYVLLNSRKHRRPRRKVHADVDPASSGRWFKGWKRPVAAAEDPPIVPQPHTWLVRAGWRRHGLLDPDEVPGLG